MRAKYRDPEYWMRRFRILYNNQTGQYRVQFRRWWGWSNVIPSYTYRDKSGHSLDRSYRPYPDETQIAAQNHVAAAVQNLIDYYTDKYNDTQWRPWRPV